MYLKSLDTESSSVIHKAIIDLSDELCAELKDMDKRLTPMHFFKTQLMCDYSRELCDRNKKIL
jgi:hypothetical protein